MNHPIEKQIADFWEGKLSATEKQQLLDKLHQDNAEWLQVLQQAYNTNAADTNNSTDKDAQYFASQLSLIKERVAITESVPVLPMQDRRSLVKWWWAAAVIILSAGLFWLYSPTTNSNDKASIAESNIADSSSAVKMLQLANNGTTVQSATMADGSLLVLQPGTVLSYTADYGKNIRAISLIKGQAFFKVAKDAQHPFIVSADGIDVRAVGTAFSVSKANAGKVSVRLDEGKVVVNPSAGSAVQMKPFMLNPGDELLIDVKKNKAGLVNAEKAAATVPVQVEEVKEKPSEKVRLQFQQQPLEEVFHKLEKYYRIQIIYSADDVKGLWFTGIFRQGDSMHTVINTICKINDLRFSFANDQIIISKK